MEHEIVQHRDLVAGREQFGHQNRTEIAGAAGDEDR